MATLLLDNPGNLVVILFGKRAEFTADDDVVSCVIDGVTHLESIDRASEVAGQIVDWFTLPLPRPVLEAGPIFTETFRFWTSGQKTACFAIHSGNLGVRENPESVRQVMQSILTWLGAP